MSMPAPADVLTAPNLTSEAFETIRRVVSERAGIELSESKRELVCGRLARRLRALRCASYEEYARLIASKEGEEECHSMICAVTTNVTDFWREPHHFEHVRDHVAAAAIADARKGAPIRFWSAGSSDGREALSLGATLLDAANGSLGNADLRILATDIDTDILRKARAGRYAAAEGDKLPPALRDKWFKESAGYVEPVESLRRLIQYNPLNLKVKWPMKRRFRGIFCRNVLIYFPNDLQAELMVRFAEMLEPNGFLYLGHSERLHGPALSKFKPCCPSGFQKVSGA
ncbi:CheR family methyltransferase [Notoacmeibacter ruber]|uniref:Chemotaxis protein methyltransferase n=1 Tax=Notoacmeibacter ruber TaxID=2670375 RepID=A0A3L7JEB7_9HYPH|nr:CheR family methyltransferase [Notoacmeibacter ruber]RLQ88804.1 chemotaxis protein [Notoacmeibacter ruber]